MALQPLHGEDAQILTIIGASADVLHDDAPTIAAREALDAAIKQDWRLLWEFVDPELHAELGLDATPGPESGPDRLRNAVERTGKTPLALFFGGPTVAIRSYSGNTPPEQTPPAAGPSIVTVYAYGPSGDVRPLPMRFDGSHWHINAMPSQ